MKKFLSVLISVMMVAGLFVALIPSASAVTVTNDSAALKMPEDIGQPLYTEDFEGENLYNGETALADHALTKALGWKQAEDIASVTVNGETHDAYAQEGLAGTGTATLKSNATNTDHSIQLKMEEQPDGYGWGIQFVNDERLAGGNYIVEFTMVIDSVPTTSNWGINFRNNHPWQYKTATGVNSSVLPAEDVFAYNIQIKRNGLWDCHLKPNSTTGFASGDVLEGADSTANWLGGIEGTNSGTAGELNDTYLADDANSILGCENTFRMVVDASAGVHMFVLNQNTREWMYYFGMDETSRTAFAQNVNKLGSGINLIVRSDVTWSVDDISVYSYGTETSVKLLGYQTTSLHNATHDVRFIAGVKNAGAVSMGFNIQYSFTRDGTPVSGNKDVYCEYLYQNISTDFGDDVLNADVEGYDYFLALTVTDVPSDLDVTYTVTPFAIFEEEDVLTREDGTQKTYSVSRNLTAGVPTLSGGTLASTKEFTTDYYRQFYTDTTEAEYTAYINGLSIYGFELYDENTIDGNIFKTYKSDWMLLHAYYIASNQTASVVYTEADTWTPYAIEPTEGTQVTTPTLSMMNLDYDADGDGTYNHNNGMSFVYTLEDSSYVIIDGGYADDADELYNYLVANNKRKDGKILIRAWIITHTDGDHYKCFNEFSSNYASNVTLEYFVAQFDSIHLGTVTTSIFNNVAKYTGCKTIVPLAGQEMYFGTLKLEFFFTAEMYQGYTGSDLTTSQKNESSLVFKGTLGDYSVFFGADIMYGSIDAVAAYYSTSLKSDYLQGPHHALDGTEAFYADILPKYFLMCTHKEAAYERWDQEKYAKANLDKLKALGCVEKVYVADEQIHVFAMSDTPFKDPTPTVTVGTYSTENDCYTFEDLFGGN